MLDTNKILKLFSLLLLLIIGTNVQAEDEPLMPDVAFKFNAVLSAGRDAALVDLQAAYGHRALVRVHKTRVYQVQYRHPRDRTG